MHKCLSSPDKCCAEKSSREGERERLKGTAIERQGDGSGTLLRVGDSWAEGMRMSHVALWGKGIPGGGTRGTEREKALCVPRKRHMGRTGVNRGDKEETRSACRPERVTDSGILEGIGRDMEGYWRESKERSNSPHSLTWVFRSLLWLVGGAQPIWEPTWTQAHQETAAITSN